MVSSTATRIALKCLRCQSLDLAEKPDGGYECRACQASYPKVKGVLRFVGSEHYAGSFGYQWNRFSKTQLDSARGTTRSHDTFIERTGWKLADLRGKSVLDAGCGMGRFAEIAADAGADVHAIDLSSAVEAAAGNLGARPNMTFYQADIFNLPFAEGSFDYIYSLGVLHHTPDTRRAFLALTKLLKPGGRISIWVYSHRAFRYYFGSELLRPLTSRLPKPLLLSLCRVAVPLYYVHKVPKLGIVSTMILPTSHDADPAWRWLDTFDWYSPTFQWKHTHEEVRGWFAEAGLSDITSLPFPESVTAIRPLR
jgi:SAM-dependent methyltransferase